MELVEIQRLVAKFWEGETTLEEEKALASYFKEQGEAVPEDLRGDASYFRYLEIAQQPSEISDERLLKELKDEKSVGKGKQVFVNWFGNAAKIAAVVVIVVLAVVAIRKDYDDNKEKLEPVLTDTFEDPQAAFEETKRALMLVSQKFGEGKKHARKLGALDDATDKVKELEREL